MVFFTSCGSDNWWFRWLAFG